MADNPSSFGARLRQLRQESGLSQEAFAKKLGTSKQVLSRYETGQRAPKVTLAREYAEKLGVSLDYLLGDTEQEAAYAELRPQEKGPAKAKPFYKIFIEVTEAMGLDIPAIVRLTGLTDWQVRTVIMRQMKDAPLPLALRLSATLDVPLAVWAGGEAYSPAPAALSPEALAVARAYEAASEKDKNTVRAALELPAADSSK